MARTVRRFRASATKPRRIFAVFSRQYTPCAGWVPNEYAIRTFGNDEHNPDGVPWLLVEQTPDTGQFDASNRVVGGRKEFPATGSFEEIASVAANQIAGIIGYSPEYRGCHCCPQSFRLRLVDEEDVVLYIRPEVEFLDEEETDDDYEDEYEDEEPEDEDE